jgi:hypothetical protein
LPGGGETSGADGFAHLHHSPTENWSWSTPFKQQVLQLIWASRALRAPESSALRARTTVDIFEQAKQITRKTTPSLVTRSLDVVHGLQRCCCTL